MIPSTKEDFEKLIQQLKSGEIKPDYKVDGESKSVSLLTAALECFHSKFTGEIKENVINSLLELGCDPDQLEYVGGMTPLVMACMGGKYQGSFATIVKMMLVHHTKGDLSDLNVMKAAAKSLNWDMFSVVVKSGKVDVNATRMQGSHILHYLATEPFFSNHLDTILSEFPDLIRNPVNRKGLSPFAVAVNSLNTNALNLFKKYQDTQIIGKLEQPTYVVAYDLVDRYVGNFWNDYPEMINYAIKCGKENLLPNVITDIFIF